jgi:hypothetical protein
MPDETPDPGLSALARALAAAAPHPGRLDRDALIFAAGRAAGARRARGWRYSTAAMALLSAGLAAALTLRTPAVVEVERVVVVPAAPPAVAERPPAPPEKTAPLPAVSPPAAELAEGLRLRQRVLREGVAALPAIPPSWYAPPERPLSESDVPELGTLHRFAAPITPGGPTR